MNELLWAAAVGAAFGAGSWLGQRMAIRGMARAAVRDPLAFLAMAERIVGLVSRVRK